MIYNSGQLSFTTVPFSKCTLPVGQELIFIQVSHDIWAYYMFKQHIARMTRTRGDDYKQERYLLS